MEAVTAPLGHVAGSSTLIQVDEQTQIGAARRSAVALGYFHGLGGDAVARLAIIVTEGATNVLLHGGGGIVLLRPIPGAPPEIEVLVIDKGRGIPDVANAMRSGYSTSGTAGQGLGAIQRLAHAFEIHSELGRGTVVMARVRQGPRPVPGALHEPSFEDRIGAICVPLRGQEECGDAWQLISNPHATTLMVVDGLGHGPDAAAASAIALSLLPRYAGSGTPVALAAFDSAMRGTRGAALSMARIDHTTRTVDFAGVGNVDARVIASGPSATYFSPQNGIVGHTMPNIKPSLQAWPVGATLVMHSDGISARWRAETYSAALRLHPSILAAVLFRDCARHRDDATVIVLRDPHR